MFRLRVNIQGTYGKFQPLQRFSLKLDQPLFQETEDLLKEIKMPRNRCINEALAYHNRFQKRKIRERRLLTEQSLATQEIGSHFNRGGQKGDTTSQSCIGFIRSYFIGDQ